jgi:hypothetical protein
MSFQLKARGFVLKSLFGRVMGEYLQKQSMTLAMFGRCEQSGYNLATIQLTIQLIIAIKQGLN